MATDQTHSQAVPSHYVGETKEMLAAFQMYVAMGEKRSIAAVAEKIGRPEKTVNNWHKRFEWRLRLLAIQEEDKQRALSEIKESYFKDAENLRKYKYDLLDMLKAKVAVDCYCGECQQGRATISEIIRVLEVVKTELGEPTSIAKGTWTEDKPNPFAGIFNRVFNKEDEPASNS